MAEGRLEMTQYFSTRNMPRCNEALSCREEGAGVLDQLRKKWLEDGSWIAALP